MIFTLFIKRPRLVLFPSRAQSNPSPASSSNTQGSGEELRTFNHVWIQPPRSVDAFLYHRGRHQEAKRGQVFDPRNLHRLPTRGQVIPTPEPNESVVFISHFLRGLGLTLDPFVRGLMFYYGLDFHDLASDSVLHISSFIVMCEAFLRITPHFGLWLKTFNVKPKMIEG